MKPIRALAALFVVATVVSACSSSTPSASTLAASAPAATGSGTGQRTQTSEGGQVTVVVAWAGPSAGATFDVTLDTHSVDLDSLDLANAILRNDRGETMTARPWEAAKGGHHREGTLTFDGDASAFLSGAKWFELLLADVGDVPERTLRWELAS